MRKCYRSITCCSRPALRRASCTPRAQRCRPGCTRPERLEGDGRVQRVMLSDQTSVPCDFAIAAVGAVANKDILRTTSIAAEKAILVDQCCRTNVEGIYAAGDCCAIFDPLFGKHR